MDKQIFSVKDGEFYFANEDFLSQQTSISFHGANNLFSENSTAQKPVKVKKSTKRNNQNHIRTLNRKLICLTMGDFKIQFIRDNEYDKKIPLAICYFYARKGELKSFQDKIEKSFPHFEITSKDQKLQKHVKFLLNLSNKNFEELQVENTFCCWAKIGQNKSHPLKNYDLSAYKQVVNQLSL